MGLTKEQILAMPAGVEMDALVAERVMGCKPTKVWNGYDCACSNEYRRPHADETLHEDKCHSQSGLNCDNTRLAGYSTDIASAWEVVERIRSSHEEVIINDGRNEDWRPLPVGTFMSVEFQAIENGAWFCAFYRVGGGIRSQGDGYGRCAVGQGLPLAICRAALLTTVAEEPPQNGPI